MSAALGRNKHLYKNKIKNLRRNNPHEIFVLENEKKFLDISKKRLIKYKKKIKNYNFAKIHWKFSDVEMINFNNRIATQYKILPLCNPDFIYLDGPDQFNIKNSINKFNIAHKDLMPMSSDILKIEFFLVPGTIILIDGRGANANFLKLNFKRNWLYSYDKEYDQHIFYLNDKSFGTLNDRLLKFYKS